ncbi:unnamed protein product (macronuclear) [Paramecium tetraurelia]|uniref:Uncharacterized protein n=1 Tax=Paramecium tetraurelia TaxID=5888 RepID=A0DI08_PARTE|nr:uncharacterized protein GSPATT00017046001 [Paramecium tetraurelia]CAK82675.1 unnamed protein product [Paramecium tetraurelia]|eukprot:XP_001450072.1 hypothetical protein (macronuclear) [Paramecium tetraurelia strain d4-2]
MSIFREKQRTQLFIIGKDFTTHRRQQKILIIRKLNQKQLKQQVYQQLQTAVKQYYRVQNLFHKNYFKEASIKIIKTQKTYPFRSADYHCKTERQQFQEQESFASYIELKLNQLYTDSIDAQNSLRSKQQSCPNSLLQSYLINTNADIIDISNQKMLQIRKYQK